MKLNVVGVDVVEIITINHQQTNYIIGPVDSPINWD